MHDKKINAEELTESGLTEDDYNHEHFVWRIIWLRNWFLV